MKRRRIIPAACGLAVVVAFGWLLFVSGQNSTETAKIAEASLSLRFGNPEAVASSRRTLEELGPRATDVLVQQASRKEGVLLKLRRKLAPLVSRSWRARINRVLPARDLFSEKLSALHAFSVLGTNAAEAVPVMEAALSDPQLPIAWAAATALANVGEKGLPPLIRALQSATGSVRQAACQGLSQAGTNAAPAVSKLISLLNEPDLAVRLAVQDSLLRIGGPAVEPLAQAALAHDEHTRTGAVHVLHIAQCDTRPAVTILVNAGATNDLAVRGFAARALGQVCPWETNAVIALTRLLEDSQETIRLEAARSLKQSGVRAAPALRSLTNLLQDPSPAIREAAVETLTRLGGFAQPALPELEMRLNDPVESVRNAASNGIAVIRAASPRPGAP